MVERVRRPNDDSKAPIVLIRVHRPSTCMTTVEQCPSCSPRWLTSRSLPRTSSRRVVDRGLAPPRRVTEHDRTRQPRRSLALMSRSSRKHITGHGKVTLTPTKTSRLQDTANWTTSILTRRHRSMESSGDTQQARPRLRLRTRLNRHLVPWKRAIFITR
jgi:hypothetical protein